MPHHITQRVNRRQLTFFIDEDYSTYLDLMTACCGKYAVDIWAYCLMPNHIHLIAVPAKSEGLRLAIGEAQRRYTRGINTPAAPWAAPFLWKGWKEAWAGV